MWPNDLMGKWKPPTSASTNSAAPVINALRFYNTRIIHTFIKYGKAIARNGKNRHPNIGTSEKKNEKLLTNPIKSNHPPLI